MTCQFRGCTRLTEVVFPAALTTVCNGGFDGSTSLKLTLPLPLTLTLTLTLTRQPEQLAALATLDINRLLAGIHCFRVHDAAEQLAVVRKLPSFLLQRPKV